MAQPNPPELEQLSVLSLRLVNGSRVISLPGREEVVRGYTCDLLVADEAAWIPDALIEACRPMLAVSGGRLIGMSTARATIGWFYNAWTSDEPWHRVMVTAEQCPRITAAFLESERKSLPAAVFIGI